MVRVVVVEVGGVEVLLVVVVGVVVVVRVVVVVVVVGVVVVVRGVVLVTGPPPAHLPAATHAGILLQNSQRVVEAS